MTVTTTYRSVLAVREFRVLLTGLLVYSIGFEFEILGLSVVVYAQTRSAFWAALAFGAGFAPQAVGGALLTSLADRLPPRTVITGGLLIRAAPGVLIGLVPGMPVVLMLVLVAVVATTAPVFNAAIAAVLPDVLDGDRYVLGRSVLSLTSSGTQILGLGIGGAVLVLLPARQLLLLAGCAIALSALVRFRLRPRSARSAASRSGRGVVRATMAGNAVLFGDATVRGLLLALWLPCSLLTGAESLIVPYTGSLGHPASAAGPLLAAVPAGMLTGDVLVGRFCRPVTRQLLAFPLGLLLGAPLLPLAARPPLLAAAVLLFAAGFATAYQLGIQQALVDSVPAALRGQAFGLISGGLMGGQGVLPALAGVLALAAGPGGAMALTGGGTVLTVLALRRPLRPASATQVGAAVDVDDLAGDVARGGRGEERHGGGDVGGGAGPAGAGLADEPLGTRVGEPAAEELAAERQAGGDHVRGDPARS